MMRPLSIAPRKITVRPVLLVLVLAGLVVTDANVQYVLTEF